MDDGEGTGRIFSPNGAVNPSSTSFSITAKAMTAETSVTVERFQEYLSERSGAVEDLAILDQYSWDRNLHSAMENSIRSRVAKLDHDLACDFDLCGLEPVNWELYALGAAGIVRGVIGSLSASEAGIVASNGTRIIGFTRHGINRAIGDAAERAGTRPQAILDAVKNPTSEIVEGIDTQGRPFQIFRGANARVIVNPQTGQIVSTNLLSAAGAF